VRTSKCPWCHPSSSVVVSLHKSPWLYVYKYINGTTENLDYMKSVQSNSFSYEVYTVRTLKCHRMSPKIQLFDVCWHQSPKLYRFTSTHTHTFSHCCTNSQYTQIITTVITAIAKVNRKCWILTSCGIAQREYSLTKLDTNEHQRTEKVNFIEIGTTGNAPHMSETYTILWFFCRTCFIH